MNIAEIRKAMLPLVTAGLVAGANAIGIAPELITDEVTMFVMAILAALAGLVYQIPNKEKSQ